jgi:DNA-binding MarR family transcriptional regulator
VSIAKPPLGHDLDAPVDRQAATGALRTELRGYQTALDGFDEAVSQRLGVNRTDLRCLDLLEQHGPMTAGALAEASGLTSGAVTFVLDRLERAGFLRRRRDPSDRRRVVVELEPAGNLRAWALHEPFVHDARAAAANFSVEELAAICRFLRTCKDLYTKHAAELRKPTEDE